MEEPSPIFVARLLRAIAVAALPANAQEQWLGSLGLGWLPVDELALEVGDGVELAPQFIERGWLPRGALAPLLALDSQLDAMSGDSNSVLWTVDALRSRWEWDECRRRALEVLLTV